MRIILIKIGLSVATQGRGAARGPAMPGHDPDSPDPTPARAAGTRLLQRLSAAGVFVSSLLGAAVVHAETAAPEAPSTDDSGDQLQEVTVTGVRSLLHDKLPEDQQDTPQSITVVSRPADGRAGRHAPRGRAARTSPASR